MRINRSRPARVIMGDWPLLRLDLEMPPMRPSKLSDLEEERGSWFAG
jgi:hypothetical protein